MEHSLPSNAIGSAEYFNSTYPEVVEERESLRETIMQYQREKEARYNEFKEQKKAKYFGQAPKVDPMTITQQQKNEEYLEALRIKVEEQKRIILKRMDAE